MRITHPLRIFTLVLLGTGSAACYLDLVPLRLLGPAMANTSRDVSILDGQTYAERGGRRLDFDLFRPVDADLPMPLVVMVHGGSWRNGNRTWLLELAYDIAAQGFATALIDYRLANNGIVFPVPVSDVIAAVRFFRDNAVTYGIDPQRIGLLGMSAGGHLALLAGLTNNTSIFDPDLPPGHSLMCNVVIDLFGPTDLTVDPSTGTPDQIDRVEHFIGTSLVDAGELLARASPITYVRADGPPVLVIHGEADTLVPIDQAQRFVQALESVGQPHVFRAIPGMDHIPGGLWQWEYMQSYRETIFAFLQERL